MEAMNDINRNRLPLRVLYIPVTAATIFTTGTMAVGFLMCVGLAILVNFKRSIATHCRVPNLLPSISAAIALPPSSYIWRLSIMLTTVQRLIAVKYHHMSYVDVRTRWNGISLVLWCVNFPLIILMYMYRVKQNHANQRSYAWYPVLCNACAMAELLENLSLIALTCVSSTENTDLHEKFFISFQVCATVFMLLMCVVYKMACGPQPTSWERKSLKAKYRCFAVNITCFLIAACCYLRHTYYCDPYAYTIFSFFEYIVVLTNILYHGFVTYDFGDLNIVIAPQLQTRKD